MRTQISGNQVLDNSIQNVDIDITTPGKSLITKVVAGNNISLSSTGVDVGTGVVTINLSGTIPISNGGTGASTILGAKSNLGFPGKYAINIGDGVSTSIIISHNLGTVDCCVEVVETSSPFSKVYPDVYHKNANTVTLEFAIAPTLNQYRVIVIG